MTDAILDKELIETKKHADSWINAFATSLGSLKAESLGYKCNVGKHSLVYDIVSVSTAKPIIHVAFTDILDKDGKSKLLNDKEYNVLVTINDKFWDEPVKNLVHEKFRESMRQVFKNPRIAIKYGLLV